MPLPKLTDAAKVSMLSKLLKDIMETKKEKKLVACMKRVDAVFRHLKLKKRVDMMERGERLIAIVMENKKKKKQPKPVVVKVEKVTVKPEEEEVVMVTPASMKTYKEKGGMLTPEALLEIERDFEMLEQEEEEEEEWDSDSD